MQDALHLHRPGVDNIERLILSTLKSYRKRLIKASECTPHSEALDVAGKAIKMIKEDEGFSDKDLMLAVLTVKDPAVANIYPHMKRMSACKSFLHCHMEKFSNEKRTFSSVENKCVLVQKGYISKYL